MPSKKNKSKIIGKSKIKDSCSIKIKTKTLKHQKEHKNNEKIQHYKNYINSLTPLEREKLEFNLILLFMMLMMLKMENKKNLIVRYHQLKNKKIIDKKYEVDDFLQSYTNFKKCVPLKKSIKKKSIKKKTKKNSGTKSNRKKTKVKIKKSIKGGAYLQRLEDLGDKPITGDDLKKSLDEITEILDGLKYTPKGSAIKPFSMFLNLFRGNDYDLNYKIKMEEAPQYFEYMPPSLNIKNIITLIPDLVEYITIYLNHRKKVKEYLVESGKMKPGDIEPNSFEIMAQQFQDNKDAFDSKLSNLTSPKNAIKRKMMM